MAKMTTAEMIEKKEKELLEREQNLDTALAKAEQDAKDKMLAAEAVVTQTEEKLAKALEAVSNMEAEKEKAEMAEMTDFVSELSFVGDEEKESMSTALFNMRKEEGFNEVMSLVTKAQTAVGNFAEQEHGHAEAGEVESGSDFQMSVKEQLKLIRKGAK